MSCEFNNNNMGQIKSLEDLKKMRESLQSTINLRVNSENADQVVQVKVAMATCGIASGAKEVMELFIKSLDAKKINAVVTQTGCMGYCYAEPTVEIKKPGADPIVFGYVNPAKAEEIITKYIVGNELVDGIIPVNYETINK